MTERLAMEMVLDLMAAYAPREPPVNHREAVERFAAAKYPNSVRMIPDLVLFCPIDKKPHVWVPQDVIDAWVDIVCLNCGAKVRYNSTAVWPKLTSEVIASTLARTKETR